MSMSWCAVWGRPVSRRPSPARQQGLKTVVLEKGQVGTYRSATIGGLTDRIHKKYGVEFDAKQWLDDAMVNSMFYGNQAIYQRWIDTQEEAINWFLDLFGLPDEDFKLTFAAGDFPDFYEPYDPTSLSRSWNTSINIPLAPAEIVELLRARSRRPARSADGNSSLPAD